MSTLTPEQTPGPDNSGRESIHVLMGRVMAEVGAIGKRRSRDGDIKYEFRGIEAVMNALHPIFARHGVFVVPTLMEERIGESRETNRGGTLNVVHLRIRYRFYGPAGDYVEAEGRGEAHDSSDKATNKAQSAALKYLLTTTFCIPTEDIEDQDDSREDGAIPTQRARRAQNLELRNRVAALCQANGWDIAATVSEFQNTYGVAGPDATPDDLLDFLTVLERRAQGAVAVEPTNVPEAETQGEGVKAQGTPPEDGKPPSSSGGPPPHEFYPAGPGLPCREDGCGRPAEDPVHVEPDAEWFRDALLATTSKDEAKRLYRRALMKGHGDAEVGDANSVPITLEDLATQRLKELA